MPTVGKQTGNHETNGHANRLTPFAAYVKSHLRPGTDDVVIGPDVPAPGVDEERIQTATMADAAKVVAGIRYLVRGWVPFGNLTGVVAEPGVGKSAFALYGLARPIITGCNWFTGANGPGKPGHVLWCATENDKVRENLKRIKMYLTTKLKQEEQDFFRAKNGLLERAALAQRYTNFAAPSADEAEVLRAGQARVLKLREELAAVNEQLKDPEAERRRLEIEAELQQRRSRDADVEAAIRSITIGPVNASGQVVSYLI